MEASNSIAQKTILIILLYTTSTITFVSALSKTNVEFIKSSCSFTTYPTLCVNSLSTRAGAIQTSPKLLAQTALSVTLDTTRSTSAAIVKLSQIHGMAPLEVAAMKDCIELLGDSVYELEKSLEEMSRPGSKSSRLVISDLQTWVSAAMTDEDTCIEGFGNTKMKNVVRGKIVNVAQLTSNALALINSYASFSKQP
ncbi:pectinesterase inhibitor 10-like [Cynara cardunculus var. scolymus]|uniref:Pectinesterase inhibitor n=1 Tax=Cynara cardunculus var. scolymus TaxID=59895 RepID=A0A103Y8N1_CYNCS|nr:pectinesterase inhibitor 10-like [Cynara cardunculus var. scolymus]KVI04552.1 Pectinesterase inhibitor [Cynara cardunculus var. scolymus]